MCFCPWWPCRLSHTHMHTYTHTHLCTSIFVRTFIDIMDFPNCPHFPSRMNVLLLSMLQVQGNTHTHTHGMSRSLLDPVSVFETRPLVAAGRDAKAFPLTTCGSHNHTPTQTRPNQTRPSQPRPDQTKPTQTRPDQTRTNQTRSDQAASGKGLVLERKCWAT